MMNLLVLLGIILGVGFALYCMVCERVLAHQERRATQRSRHTETVLVPRRTFVAAQPIGPTRP